MKMKTNNLKIICGESQMGMGMRFQIFVTISGCQSAVAIAFAASIKTIGKKTRDEKRSELKTQLGLSGLMNIASWHSPLWPFFFGWEEISKGSCVKR